MHAAGILSDHRGGAIIKHIGVFFLFAAIFFLFHVNIEGFISNGDPYYHARHSALIAQTGNLTFVKPWLEFHFLRFAPSDPWWGFHVLQSISISLFGIWWGPKVLSIILAATAYTVFYSVLKCCRARMPFVWTFLYFATSGLFIFRVLLERPHVFTLIFAPLVWWALKQKKHVLLFLLIAVFTLLYHMAPMLISIVVIVSATEYWLTRKILLRPLIAAIGGLLTGIILHPQSMHFLYALSIMFWKVIYLKLIGVELGVGNELNQIAFHELVITNAVTIILSFCMYALVISLKNIKKKPWAFDVFSLGALSIFWFTVTLVIPRGVEYWIPFSWLFIAISLTNARTTIEWREIACFIRNTLGSRPFVHYFVYLALLVAIITTFGNIIVILKESNKNDPRYYYQAANEWLIAHTEPGEVVFYPNWSMWPMMFFYNQHNHFINGMDPTFMYDFNETLFWKWFHISVAGVYCDQENMCVRMSPKEQFERIPSTVFNTFHSRYIIIPNQEDIAIYKTLRSFDQYFKKVYENKELMIYEIISL